MKTLLFVLCVSGFYPSFSQNSIDQICKNWNDQTLSCIRNEIYLTNDSTSKKLLQKRFTSLSESFFLENTGEKPVRLGESIRHKFLRAIFSNPLIEKKFFVIETKYEGEVTMIRNLVVVNKAKHSLVLIYYCSRGTWFKSRDTLMNEINLNHELNCDGSVSQKWDNNPSEFIISSFDGKKVESHYYLPSSINNTNEILKVLKLDEYFLNGQLK